MSVQLERESAVGCKLNTEDKHMVSIRPATIADKNAIFHLATQLSQAFVVDRDSFSASFELIRSDPTIYLYVAERQGVVVAYLLGWSRPVFYANGLVAWVQEIVVDPAYRRGGIGMQLMSHFEAWALTQDCRLVSLASRGAGEFYQTIGYTEGATYYKKMLNG